MSGIRVGMGIGISVGMGIGMVRRSRVLIQTLIHILILVLSQPNKRSLGVGLWDGKVSLLYTNGIQNHEE